MNIEKIAFLCSILIPIGLFVFTRGLLNQEKYKIYLRSILSAIAVVGILLSLFINQVYYFTILLIIPLISYLIYFYAAKWYIRRFQRLPIDTTNNWQSGLKWDRLFNIGYIIIGVLFPFGILLMILTISK